MKQFKILIPTLFISLLLTSLLIPDYASAASAKKPKPLYSFNSLQSNNTIQIGNNGEMIFIDMQTLKNESKLSIESVSKSGKKTTWNDKSKDRISAVYATNQKGNEIFYVYDKQTRILKGLSMKFKEIWRVKLSKDYINDQLYSSSINPVTGDIIISEDQKQKTLYTMAGKKKQIRIPDNRVKKVGDFEYRLDTEKFTLQKINTKTGKTIFIKRPFDLNYGSDYNFTPSKILSYAFDDDGSSYISVSYENFAPQFMSIDRNGNIVWQKGSYANGIKDIHLLGNILYYNHIGEYYAEVDPDVTFNIANKKTGKTLYTFDNSSYAPFDLVTHGRMAYAIDTQKGVWAIDSNARTVWHYKVPQDRYLREYGFDNKNNFYTRTVDWSTAKKKISWVHVFSEKGKLLSKKQFDQNKYDRLLIDPNGKQHYQLKIVQQRNHKQRIDVDKF